MDNKLETAILEKEALDGIDGDFEDNFQYSYDNNISHNYTSNKELYGKAQHLMSEKGTFSECVSDNNYSHIAYVLECMEDELDEKTNEDYANKENIGNADNHNMDMEYQNELQFANCFPELAAIASVDVTKEDHGKLDKKKKAGNEIDTKTGTTIVHAPLSGFDFCRNFTSEEYFMVKLCHICDKANVPHHVIDDIVCLLQEFKINNIQLQPEKLLKRNNFLKHLEKCFYSPVPQSVVVDLESSQAMIFIT